MFITPHHRKIEAPSEIIRDGLVSRWPFDDGVGSPTFRDDQGSDPGILSNLNPSTAWVAGRGGADIALDTNPQGQGIVAHNSVHYAVTFSICLWFKFNASPESFGAIMTKSGATWNNGWGLYYHQDQLKFWYAAYNKNASVPFSPSDRDWHLIICSNNGTTLEMSLDDVAGTTGPGSSNTQTQNHDLQFNGPVYFADPVVQDGRYYDRILNASEKTSIFLGTG